MRTVIRQFFIGLAIVLGVCLFLLDPSILFQAHNINAAINSWDSYSLGTTAGRMYSWNGYSITTGAGGVWSLNGYTLSDQANGNFVYNVTAQDFGTLTTGATTVYTMTGTVQNTSVWIGPTTLAGDTDFSLVSNGCTTGLQAPNYTCNLEIQFAPTTETARAGTWTQRWVSATTTPLVWNTATQDFGTVTVGTWADFTLTATAKVPLTWGTITISGTNAAEYTLVSHQMTYNNTIAKDGTATAVIRFTPTTTATGRVGSISLPANW